MTRLLSLIVLLLLLPAASVLAGDLPQVLQPNTTAYSASEVAALTQGITTLTEALNDYDMASRRYFSASEWSSRDFAAYTAGILTGKGYKTEIVSGAGWADGTHTWVLVGIPLGMKTAWIPVEATPEAGHSQQVLGRMPSSTDTAGGIWFDAPYLAFVTLVQLPLNIAPVAMIRQPALTSVVGESEQLLALGSHDPDGEIVLYKWDFGDGQTSSYDRWAAYHEYGDSGSYTVLLTVVDNRGQNGVTSVTLRVLQPRDADSPPSKPGCGCGS